LQAGWATLRLLPLLAAFAAVPGCDRGPSSQPRHETPPEAVHPGEGGYAPPPELVAVVRGGAGRLSLSGTAAPLAQVRLGSPGRTPLFAAADAAGRWRLQLSAPAQPLLLGLSMSDHGRTVQAGGYLFLSPEGQAARLRAGGGSEILDAGAERLVLTALDYDNQRAATLSGLAPAGETVSVKVDGAGRRGAVAGLRGRFVAPLNPPLSNGPHTLEVAAGAADAVISIAVDSPAALTGAPYRITRTTAGWRIDWLTPGGGEQTTLIFPASPEPAA
jgi:hypothetical protein